MKGFKIGSLFLAALALIVTSKLVAADDEVNLAFSTIHVINGLEISASQQVTARGQDQEAKALATTAIDRHTKMDAQLGDYAKTRSITLLDAKDIESDELSSITDAVAKLNDLSGVDLDKAFATAMVRIHAFSLETLYRSQCEFRTSDEGQFLAKWIPQVKDGYDASVKLADRLH